MVNSALVQPLESVSEMIWNVNSEKVFSAHF